MKIPGSSLVGIGVVALAGTTARPLAAQQASALSYEAIADAYLKESGIEDETLTFPGLLEGEGFVRCELGAFDVRIPRAGLEQGELGERVIDACVTLVELQRAWSAWRGAGSDAAGSAEDWDELAKWVTSWAPRKLAACKGGAHTLYEELGAKEKVLAAAARLRQATAYPEKTIELVGDRNVTVLLPSRKLFLEVVCAAGKLVPGERANLWSAPIVSRGAMWADWIQLVALEAPGPPDGDPFAGNDFSVLDRTALGQHVADRGATVLLRKEFCQQGTHFFEESLGTNLVIATVGLNGVFSADWKVQYHTAGGSTQPYTRFVPGAGPPGGTLPPRKATAGPTIYSGSMSEIGRYRASLGKGYFLEPLQDGQKEGAKLAAKEKSPLAADKRPHFELHSLTANASTVVSAPFLGHGSEEKALPPNEYLDDYEDFFRAYRSCFVHWLQTEPAGAESAQRFAALLARHAGRKPGETLDQVVEEIYHVPLSAADGSAESLEWSFLTWLQKAK